MDDSPLKLKIVTDWQKHPWGNGGTSNKNILMLQVFVNLRCHLACTHEKGRAYNTKLLLSF